MISNFHVAHLPSLHPRNGRSIPAGLHLDSHI
jgi:hypothetical protein